MEKKNFEELGNQGYTIIRNIISEEEGKNVLFFMCGIYDEQSKKLPLLKDNAGRRLSDMGPHCIWKYSVGHSLCNYYVRMLPVVLKCFGQLIRAEVDDLRVSLDGFCWMYSNYQPYSSSSSSSTTTTSSNLSANDWLHVDQGSKFVGQGAVCYQSFVTLDKCGESAYGTLRIWPKSHLYHDEMMEQFKIGQDNWHLLTKDEIEFMKSKTGTTPIDLFNIPKNSLVIWDSRCVHQNVPFKPRHALGSKVLRRVIYLSFCDKKTLTVKDLELRKKAFSDVNTTTSHWAGNDSFKINPSRSTYTVPPPPSRNWLLSPFQASTFLPEEILRVYKSIGYDEVENNNNNNSIIHNNSNNNANGGKLTLNYTSEELFQALKKFSNNHGDNNNDTTSQKGTILSYFSGAKRPANSD